MRQTRRATPDLSSFVVDSGLLKGASPDQVRRKHVGQPKERLNGTTLTASASSPSLSGSSPSYRRTRMAPIDESSRVGPSRLADPAEHGPEPASPQEMAWHGMHSTYIRSTPAVLYPPSHRPHLAAALSSPEMLAALTSPEEVARSRHAALSACVSEKLEAEQPLVPEELALLRRAIVEIRAPSWEEEREEERRARGGAAASVEGAVGGEGEARG